MVAVYLHHFIFTIIGFKCLYRNGRKRCVPRSYQYRGKITLLHCLYTLLVMWRPHPPTSMIHTIQVQGDAATRATATVAALADTSANMVVAKELRSLTLVTKVQEPCT